MPRENRASISEVVLVNAMLVYLSGRESTTLGELAEHFRIPWKEALAALWTANLAETASHEIPYDLELPDPDGQWDGEGEEPGPGARVSLRAGAARISLGLDELLIVLALIDSILEISPSGPQAAAVRETRAKLAASASERGFGTALWDPPQTVADAATTSAVDQAIQQESYLEFEYYRPAGGAAESERVNVVPVDVKSGVNPLLRALKDGEFRYYRLDRIGGARVGEPASAAQLRAAQKARDRADRKEKRALGDHGSTWSPEGILVQLTLDPGARWVAQALPDARIIPAENSGDLRIEFHARSVEWLMTFLVQIGQDVKHIGPPALAARVAHACQAMNSLGKGIA